MVCSDSLNIFVVKISKTPILPSIFGKNQKSAYAIFQIHYVSNFQTIFSLVWKCSRLWKLPISKNQYKYNINLKTKYSDHQIGFFSKINFFINLNVNVRSPVQNPNDSAWLLFSFNLISWWPSDLMDADYLPLF